MAHDTKGTQSHIPFGIVLLLLVDTRFQILFTPLAGVLFTFPSRYSFTIGRQVVLSLGGWSPQIQAGFHVSRPTRDASRSASTFAYGALTRYGRPSQTVLLASTSHVEVPQPQPVTRLVWALPRSLATTYGVSVDFLSRGYLDVSVPLVRRDTPMYSAHADRP